MGGAVAFIIWAPPTYVSSGRMWETVKLRLPEGTLFSEDIQNFLGTQAELLKSSRLQELTLAALKAASTNALPIEKDGRELKVKIQVVQAPKSTMFDVLATSSDQAYTREYLKALLNQYLEYKKSIRKEVSGGTSLQSPARSFASKPSSNPSRRPWPPSKRLTTLPSFRRKALSPAATSRDSRPSSPTFSSKIAC